MLYRMKRGAETSRRFIHLSNSNRVVDGLKAEDKSAIRIASSRTFRLAPPRDVWSTLTPEPTSAFSALLVPSTGSIAADGNRERSSIVRFTLLEPSD